MLNWAYKQWILQPLRAFLVLVVFAAVISLAMLFDGIRIGIDQDMRQFPQSISADLVAVAKDNIYFAMGPSSLPNSVLGDLWFEPDVQDAQPIAMTPFILAHANQRTPSMLIAYVDKGGPSKLVFGDMPKLGTDIVIDKNLARLHALDLGDKIKVLGLEMQIVGISVGTTSPFTPYAFVAYDPFVARILTMVMSEQGPNSGANLAGQTTSSVTQAATMSLVSAVLIDIKDGANIEQVRQNLEKSIPEADFRTPQELGNADAAFANRLLGPVLVLLSSLAWLIMLLTMSVLRHAEVQSNLHQFGIQKALGVKPLGLAIALLFGSLLIALSAFPLALLMAKGLAWIMADWNPLYNPRVWDGGVIARALLVSLIAAIAGMILPWRQLVKLAPVIVFKR